MNALTISNMFVSFFEWIRPSAPSLGIILFIGWGLWKLSSAGTKLSIKIETETARVDTKIDGLSDEMERKFQASEEKTALRFDAVDQKFDAVDQKFHSLEDKMDLRFEAVDQKFKALEEKMDLKFQALEEKMDLKFTAIEDKIDTKFDLLITIFQANQQMQPLRKS